MHHPRYFSGYITLSIAAIALFTMLAIPQVAYADGTISVDTVVDEFGAGADCSLREAIQAANTDSDFGGCTRTDTFPYTLDLIAGEFTLTLTGADEDVNATGDLDISTALTIAGAGAGDTIIQAGTTPSAAIDRVIHVLSGAVVNITDVTIRNGTTPTDGNGGGIANMGGTLTLFNSVVRDNTALGDGPGEGGGGIFNAVNSSLTLSATNLLNNSAIITLGNGGGILTAPGSTLVITGGQIENNAAARAGGGIENNGGAVTLINITLDDNTTGINGGGLHISGAGVVSMTGGTASNNTAGKEGGALWNSGPGQLIVDDVAIEENTASGDDADQGGGGLFSDGGKLIVRNSTINNNSANGTAGSGGGILIVPGSALTVTNSTVAENTAMRAGGGIEVAANLTSTAIAQLNSVDLIQNETGSSPGNGGALHITGPGSVTVSGGNVISNTASAEGGGLWNSAVGTLTVDGTTFRGNVASGAAADQGGGALFSDGGQLTVTNAIIENNVANGTAGSGGGILVVPGSVLSVTGGNITGNRAMRAGGGIEVNATVTKTVVATLNNVDLLQNETGSSPGNGGALHITGPGTVTVNGGDVINNTASAEGGGLWNSVAGSLTVDGTTFRGNVASGAAADQGGGALFSDGGKLIVRNSTISNNSANGTAGSGGGILVVPGSILTVTNSTLSENTAVRAGGGIEVNATVTKTVTAALNDVDLIQNATGASPGNGGALHITGPGSVTVVASQITSNTASAEGGGLWNSASGTLIVDKSTLSGNTATGTAADHGGGGLYNDGGALTVSNSTISGNSAQSTGGGILNAKGTTSVINVTIYENSAANGAGGINSAAGTTTLANSIVAHNTSSGADCSGVTANGANLDSDGSCQATIMADPMLGPLQSNGGATPIHELLVDSPAINAGDNAICAAAPINNVDQRGQSRPVGTACDLGAYERADIMILIQMFFPMIVQQ